MKRFVSFVCLSKLRCFAEYKSADAPLYAGGQVTWRGSVLEVKSEMPLFRNIFYTTLFAEVDSQGFRAADSLADLATGL
jgi:hypothetical protein